MARKGFLGLFGGGKKKRAAPKAPSAPAPKAPSAPMQRAGPERQTEFGRMQRLVAEGKVSSSALLPYYYRQSGADDFRAGLLALPPQDLRHHARHFGIPVQGRTPREITNDITTHVRTCKGCRLGTTERHRLKMREGR